MRDVATFVWVILLVIGVISSMVASARRRMNAQPLPARGTPPAMPPAPPVPPQLQQQLRQQLVQQMKQVPSRPAAPAAPARSVSAPAAPAPAPPAPSAPARASGRHRLFPGRHALVRAVIAAEVLGKPRALNDEYFRS